MKQIILKSAAIFLILMLVLSSGIILSSCKKDNVGDTAAPTIDKVTTLTDRGASLPAGTYSQWILIKGQHLGTTFKVDFNGTLAADSLMFANDSSVTVQIPGPLTGISDNPITVFTKYGQATYSFVINQPPPTITSFNPVSGSADDIVTISGDWFTNVTSVKFGTANATILSSSKNEIKVKLPAGVSQAYIFVTTSGGTTKSANAFGFKFIVYDDAVNSMFWIGGGWGGTSALNSTEVVKRGKYSVKISYAGGYGSPMQLGGGSLSLVGYTKVKISIYGGPGTTNNKVKLVLNGNGSKGVELVLVAGQWTDYSISLSDLGDPATLNEIWLQEYSGTNSEYIYVDDFGLI